MERKHKCLIVSAKLVVRTTAAKSLFYIKFYATVSKPKLPDAMSNRPTSMNIAAHTNLKQRRIWCALLLLLCAKLANWKLFNLTTFLRACLEQRTLLQYFFPVKSKLRTFSCGELSTRWAKLSVFRCNLIELNLGVIQGNVIAA